MNFLTRKNVRILSISRPLSTGGVSNWSFEQILRTNCFESVIVRALEFGSPDQRRNADMSEIWVRFDWEWESKKSFVNSWLLSRTLDSGIHNLLFDFVKHVDFLITKKSHKNLPPTEKLTICISFIRINLWVEFGECNNEFVGYIDVDSGCWRQFMLATDVGDRFATFLYGTNLKIERRENSIDSFGVT